MTTRAETTNPTPTAIPTAATHRFVRSQLASIRSGDRPVRVLEVGCGNGALASRLIADGYDVVALDSSDDAVRGARAAGVDARVAPWPQFDAGPNDGLAIDAVLFTRSLHHIQPLGPALDRARAVLTPNGVVIVEDFAFAEVDRKTAAWFFEELRSLDARGAVTPKADEFATRLLAGHGAYELWHSDHDHDITPAPVIRAALADRFEIVLEDREPYLYRYVCPLLSADESGARVAGDLYGRERAAGAAGDVTLIGRRFVGRKVLGW